MSDSGSAEESTYPSALKGASGGVFDRVAAHTELMGDPTYSTDDFIGSAPGCIATALPPIPDVFVHSSKKKKTKTAKPSAAPPPGYTAIEAAHCTYVERFVPHLANEMRAQIVGHFLDLVSASGDGDVGWRVNARPHPNRSQPALSPSSQKKYGPAEAWERHTCLNVNIRRLCAQVVPVQLIHLQESNPTLDLSAESFPIRALSDPPLEPYQKGDPRQGQLYRTRYDGDGAVDPEVDQAAEFGILSMLSTNSLVALLVPLSRFADAWKRHHEANSAGADALTPAELDAQVQETLSHLPPAWRQLRCVPRLARVSGVDYYSQKAVLSLYPLHVPAAYTGPSLDYLQCDGIRTTRDVLYVRKLASLGSTVMEYEAAVNIGTSQFFGMLCDPRRTAKDCVKWVDKVSQFYPSDTVGRSQLNKWQLNAVNGVLCAAFPEMCPRMSKTMSHDESHEWPQAPQIVLIEGPPGTGKTHTIATTILNLLHHERKLRKSYARVLVCAPSNTAVDEVLLRLRNELGKSQHTELSQLITKRGKLLRIGLAGKLDPEVLQLEPPVFIDYVCEREVNRRRAQGLNAARTITSRLMVKQAAVKYASVIFTTLGSVHRLRSYLQPGVSFTAVMIDEASQCTEPAVLQALAVADSRTACVLVGDSKQLQPTIMSAESSLLGLRRSLLVRMLACGHKSFLLRTQYRMHPDICDFPNTYFYAGQLATHESVHQRQEKGAGGEVRGVAHLLPQHWSRLMLSNVHEGRTCVGRGMSAFNEAEAQAVVRFMRDLRSLLNMSVNEFAAHVGVITFYKAQVLKIRSMLTPEEVLSGLQLATVDSFQGKQKRIILLSCVRSGKALERGAGFLAQWNRLNVALTRAMDLCVCFCNFDWVRSLGQLSKEAGGDAAAAPVPAAHKLTTLDSTAEEVKQQLEAHDKDPMALCRLLALVEDRAAAEQAARKQEDAADAAAMQLERLSKSQRRKANKRPDTKATLVLQRPPLRKWFVEPGKLAK